MRVGGSSFCVALHRRADQRNPIFPPTAVAGMIAKTFRTLREASMIRTPFSTPAIACLSLTGVLLCGAPLAHARVTQVVITKTESPAFGGKSFGTVGAYERISGEIIGEVDPKAPVNAVIVDIDLAQKNPNGMVGYSTDFQILRPVDRTKGSKRLLYEINNRGRTNVLGTLNDSKTENDVESSGDAGNGFLMRHGYVVLESCW